MKNLFIAATLALSTPILADTIIVQSTTSTKNSGFYDYLLPMIKKDTGIQVNVVAVGTGQAIKNARRCDGDVLLVHAKEAEEKFVADGYGEYRHDLMYNDFVIIGPKTDPANVANASDVIEALRRIREADAKFASRGDDSGTHKKERTLWQEAGIDPVEGSGQWYLETGSGMGATLNTGVGLSAYVLTDRAPGSPLPTNRMQPLPLRVTRPCSTNTASSP
ncbi:substrate-binding domain-containing protein [Marinobacter similis]|uniref:substrate-binding domain-containing protein n=1 Tax=Marinobacter similis TaxID=1420916 RepID=UPI000A9A8D80|nr:substrate-binding domain-containing protein [Marinobacter similis]